MTDATVVGILVVVLVVALIGLLVIDELRVRELRQQLAIERERTGDLLTRLAVRTPAEYVAVTRQPAPADDKPAKRWGTDPTGLVRAELTDVAD